MLYRGQRELCYHYSIPNFMLTFVWQIGQACLVGCLKQTASFSLQNSNTLHLINTDSCWQTIKKIDVLTINWHLLHAHITNVAFLQYNNVK